MKPFEVIKAVWGVLITLATLALAWGQYVTEKSTHRPVLAISHEPSPGKFAAEHGPYSHSYKIENKGLITANGVRLTVTTRQEGSVPHQDKEHPLGDVMAGEKYLYVIFVHHVVEHSPGIPKYLLTEEIEILYTGRSVLRFWCIPTYRYVVRFLYDEKRKV